MAPVTLATECILSQACLLASLSQCGEHPLSQHADCTRYTRHGDHCPFLWESHVCSQSSHVHALTHKPPKLASGSEKPCSVFKKPLPRSGTVAHTCVGSGDLRQMSEYPIPHREHYDSCILRRRCKPAFLHPKEEIQGLLDLPQG
jgi:hypothetical protein